LFQYFKKVIQMNKIHKNYFIKDGYESRLQPLYFNDNVQETIYQPDVYPLAEYLGTGFDCKYIVDIGCGSGEKLAAIFPKYQIIGIDYGTNIKECQNRWSFGKWLEHDLDKPGRVPVSKDIFSKAIIICADVIEHLTHPKYLLNNLKYMMDYAPVFLLSTPERDLVRGTKDVGPHANQHHIREWNMNEFIQLLNYFNLSVEFSGLTVNNNRDLAKKTILAILKKNRNSADKMSNSLKIVALMATYNEEDILYNSVKRLRDQGIYVYLIDNWSTDSTHIIIEEMQKQGLILGFERFPSQGPSKFYCWQDLLHRVELLAGQMDADWFIHHDVDEIRTTPWPNINLHDGICKVDHMGFNAIDHTAITFHPVDNLFISASNFEDHFKYYEFGKRPGHFTQIKAWKNMGIPVDLMQSGGHQVCFEGRCIFPYKFLLKHYPIRSQAHGEKKIFQDRQPRWHPHERQMGWHTQYDLLKPGCSFLRDPNELNYFEENEFNNEYLVERLSGIGILR